MVSVSRSSEQTRAAKSRTNPRHVSRACLECRSRHLKCSGAQPCARCDRLSKTCEYVKSHRGGSRKKGVSKFDSKGKGKSVVDSVRETGAAGAVAAAVATSEDESAPAEPEPAAAAEARKASPNLGYYIPPVEDLIKLPCINHKKSHNQRRKDYTELLKMPCAFTCLEPQYRGRTPPCMGGEVRVAGAGVDMTVVPLAATASAYEKVNSNDYVKSLMADVDRDHVIETYYTHFHAIHPILPERDEIVAFLDKLPHACELVLAMKIVGDAQSSGLYSSDIETVNFKLNQIFDYINTVVGVDVVSLQAMTLISLTAHFSSLHDLSSRIRVEAVRAILDDGYNRIDAGSMRGAQQRGQQQRQRHGAQQATVVPDSPESDRETTTKDSRPVPRSARLAGLSDAAILESCRKVFWELHFVDVIIGTADGKTVSSLATAENLVQYPHSVPAKVFDYRTRAEACQLVTDAIKLNIAVIDQEISATTINHLNASLGNWEMRLNHPELLNAPFMVDAHGRINEGIFQSMLLYNYARIFAHRPFSFLWKDMAAETEKQLGSSRAMVSARKIIETRKTIEGANAIATCLLDTSPSSIQQRTPLYGCSMAFASLVHLSSYIWAQSTLDAKPGAELDFVAKAGVEDELKSYAQFIEFELNTLSAISKHWMLANKLATYVKDTLAKVIPGLYETMRHVLPGADERARRTVALELEPEVHTAVRADVRAGVRSNTDQDADKGRILNFSGDHAGPYMDSSESYPSTELQDPATMDEVDFTYYDFNTKGNGLPESPMSDTGCDWIDKNIFEFDGDEFKNILETYEQG